MHSNGDIQKNDKSNKKMCLVFKKESNIDIFN